MTSAVTVARATNVASGPAPGPVGWGAQAAPSAWRSRDERESGPWSNRDVSRLAIVSGVGLIAVVFCWYEGSGVATLNDEMPWLVGSIGAAGLVVCSLVAWVIAGFRNVRLAEHATVLTLLPLLERLPGAPAEVVEVGDTRIAVAPGGAQYHRTSCRMVAGKAGVTYQASDTPTDLRPCAICQP